MEIICSDLRYANVDLVGRQTKEDFVGKEWLEYLVTQPCTIGMGARWRADRKPGDDNPIALLQLATQDCVLLLRTHESKRWLPQVVKEVILCPHIKKVAVESCAMVAKVHRSFNLETVNVVDVEQLAVVKGIDCIGFRSLVQHFGMSLDREPTRIDWEADHLTSQQQGFAADEVVHVLKVFEQLTPLQGGEYVDEEETSCLTLQPGWIDEGIARRHDGLWCALCNKGPMLTQESCKMHLDSKGHLKKKSPGASVGEKEVKEPVCHPISWQPGWAEQGIVQKGDGLWCSVCAKGPMVFADVIMQHLLSKGHLKKSPVVDDESHPERVPEMATGSSSEGEVPEQRCRALRRAPRHVDSDDYLALELGQLVIADAVDPTGEFLYGRLKDGRKGWFLRSVVELLEDDDSTDASLAVCITAVASPPDGFAADNFLMLQPGDAAQIICKDPGSSDWLWCRGEDGQTGWVPVAAVTARTAT